MIAGDRTGYLTLFTETGSGLRNDGHIKRDSSGRQVDIKVSANSFPFINDWNEDGKKDLIVGEQDSVLSTSGIRVYLNIGTNSAPRFSTYSLIYGGSNPIRKYRCDPVVYDLDRDGLKDLIIGHNDGCVYFYENVGTNAAPRFNATNEVLRTTGGTIIDAYYGSRLSFVDWRGDGDIDLLISGYYGYVELYENATVEVGEEKLTDLQTQNLKVSPNPIRNKAVFEYSLANRTFVEMNIYSTDGRLVAKPLSRTEDAGVRQFVWDARGLPAGVYLVRFDTGNATHTARIVIVN